MSNTSAKYAFRVLVPGRGRVSIRQTTNNYDSRHRIGYGSSCPGTQLRYVDDPDTSAFAWTNPSTSSQWVWYVVGGYGNTSQGTGTINWSVTGGTVCPQLLCPLHVARTTRTWTRTVERS